MLHESNIDLPAVRTGIHALERILNGTFQLERVAVLSRPSPPDPNRVESERRPSIRTMVRSHLFLGGTPWKWSLMSELTRDRALYREKTL